MKHAGGFSISCARRVAPHAGAWIETVCLITGCSLAVWVAPHAGAWIETSHSRLIATTRRSHPTRVRGLKLDAAAIHVIKRASHPTRVRGLKHVGRRGWPECHRVAPHAGAWIETELYERVTAAGKVAPHAGAWIETGSRRMKARAAAASHPTRVRGLKPVFLANIYGTRHVAPHAGAWIETHWWPGWHGCVYRRTPRGCVD